MSARLSAMTRTSILVLALGALSACSTTQELQPTEQEAALAEALQERELAPATAEERDAVRNQDLLTQAAFWAEAHELNPGDREAAFELSRVLRLLGGAQRSAEIARQSLALYPDDIGLLGQYGLALTAMGRGPSALEPLSRAATDPGAGWRIINALGVALEQAGRKDAARARFNQALLLAPGEPAIESNLALSYALDGQAEQAEAMLRRAARSDRATPQVRQNLALVVALQGRFDEAEQIALIDATPEMAEANMDYVRSLMSNPRRWDALAQTAEPRRQTPRLRR
ncbi:MAG: hypothetical protein AAFX09_11590 [Pseudomonadota bacterium]